MPNWASPARRAVWERKRTQRVCRVPDCQERHYSLGFCEEHWAQQRRYGIRIDRMRATFGACDICNQEAPLRVDHDHVTGAVRGHLCHGCNVGLGWFKDNPTSLRTAVAYLEAGDPA